MSESEAERNYIYVDWRVAIGVFLCLYGNNLTQS